MSDITLTIVLPEDPAKICLGSNFRIVARFNVFIRGLRLDDIHLYKNNKGEYALHEREGDWGHLYLDMHNKFCTEEDHQWWIAKLVKFYENEVANRPEEVKEKLMEWARKNHKPGDYISTADDYIYQEECQKIDREAGEVKP